MDGGATGGTAAGGGGGPAPFLLKTYEMVDDASTDAIVSWSGGWKSFVVWNPPEFARVLLPSYFKHNNFSSFIRQLNTYGFRKIDPERWEFANEDFMKDQKHLLKNIHRRKPIHSHSQPQGGSIDPERAAFEEEIDKLTREKTALEGSLLAFKEQHSSAKEQLENLTQRIGSMKQRQEKLLIFLEKAVQNPEFVERLSQKLESMDFSAYNKKRRLPQTDDEVHSVHEDVLVDNQSSCRPEFIVSDQDFCNKLRLELSTAVSDVNLLSHSTQSSNEDGMVRSAGFVCPSETLELSDTGASLNLNMDSSGAGPESPKMHCLQQSLSLNEDDGDGNLSCLLDLTLASSHLELNKCQNSIGMPLSSPEMCMSSRMNRNEDDHLARAPPEGKAQEEGGMSSSPDASKQGPATEAKRVNDVFWEQFLTERPGCSDTEEASSNYRASNYDEQEERKSGKGIARNTKGMEHLTL